MKKAETMTKGRQKQVMLPKLSSSGVTRDAPSETWLEGRIGTVNAFRQLSHSLHNGKRKTAVLPGGKLKPLFMNHTAPPSLGRGQGRTKNVLPGINDDIYDTVSTIPDLLSGSIANLPPETATSVQLYLASNYKDMIRERNIILKRAVPEVQKFCSEMGIRFQLIDLHCGMGPNDQTGKNRDIRKWQILQSQLHSIGAHFVALVGDQYGPVELPSNLSIDHRNNILSAAKDDISIDVDLLEKYIIHDNNSIPPTYKIEPPDGDKTDYDKFVKSFTAAVSLAVSSHRLTRVEADQYFVSALGRDINAGIFEVHDPRSHTLCYKREIQHLASYISSPNVDQYIDISLENEKAEINTSAQESHHILCDKIIQHLGTANCRQYFLTWGDNGLSELETEEYLDKLCIDFVNDIKNLVTAQANRRQMYSTSVKERVLQELLHHAHKAKRHACHYKGQDDLFLKVQEYLKDGKRNIKPFVVHGETGSGKTGAMACLSKKIKEWFTMDSVIVLRFLGTTSDCASVHDTINSITQQICLAYDLSPPSVMLEMGTLFDALSQFRDVLTKVSEYHACTRPLFILLDGIDQLSPYEDSMNALWAMTELPLNVHLVVSTVPQIGDLNLLDALMTLVTDPTNSAEIQPLTNENIENIISSHLEAKSRKLTSDQTIAITAIYNRTRQPLVLKYLINEAMQWSSAHNVCSGKYDGHIIDIFCRHIESLESKYGHNVVGLLVSYLTACTTGLHQSDLTDLLTCDKDVMEEVHKLYQSHPPNVTYFPPAILLQILIEMSDFIHDNLMHGQKVLGWSHKEFQIAASKKYQVIFPGVEEASITEDSTCYTIVLHEHMANHFSDTNRTEILGESGFLVAEKKGEPTITMPQPLNKLNLIKLNKLPLHLKVLLPVEGLERTKKNLLFNYQWLLTKLLISNFSILTQELLSTIALTNNLVEEGAFESSVQTDDMNILYEFFQMAAPALLKFPENLPAEIIGRLNRFTEMYSSIGELVSSVTEWADKTDDSLLLPSYQCFKAPGLPLRHIIHGPTSVVGFDKNEKYVVTYGADVGVQVCKIETGEIVQTFGVSREQNVSYIIPGHYGNFIIIGHYSHLNHIMDLSMWSTETGIRLMQSLLPHKVEAISLDKDDEFVIVATTMEMEGTPPTREKCLLGVDIHSKDVLYTLPIKDIHSDGVKHMHLVSAIRKGNRSVITIGMKPANDLGCWNLEGQELEFRMDLGCSIDQVKINQPKKTAICTSLETCQVLVIDLEMCKKLHIINDSRFSNIHDIYFTKQGQHFILATETEVIVYSVKTGLAIKTYTVKQKPRKIEMDKNEHAIFVGMQNGDISVHLASSGELITTLEGHSDEIKTLHLIENGRRLLSAAFDKSCCVWNLQSVIKQMLVRLDPDILKGYDGIDQFGKNENSLLAHNTVPEDVHLSNTQDISSIIATTDGRFILTGSFSKPIQVWDLETGELFRQIIDGCDNGVNELYFACKEKLIVGHSLIPGSDDAELRVWNFESGKQVMFSDSPGQVFCSALFPDKQDFLLTISPSESLAEKGIVVAVYDLFEMKQVTSLNCDISGNMDSSNLKLLGFARVRESMKNETENSMDILDNEDESSETGAPVRLCAILNYHPVEYKSYFFTFYVDGHARDQINMEQHEPLHLDSLSPSCTTLLSDGRCVTGTCDGMLVSWYVQTKDFLTYFYDRKVHKTTNLQNVTGKAAHLSTISCVSASSDGNLLISGDTGGHIKLWDVGKRSAENTFSFHTMKITCLLFSMNNKLIISGCDDKTIVITSRESCAKLATFYTHGSVNALLIPGCITKWLIADVLQDYPRAKPGVMCIKCYNI